jgi:beta-hydroxyacyl-ACP dehydratase FabZ
MEKVIMLEANQIAARLPHKYPMLMVDRILHIEEGVRAIGLKNVTSDESYVEGHFPSEPIMPGTLVIECMAQTAALAFGHNDQDTSRMASSKKPRYLVRIQNMKFRKKVIPGDQLIIEVRILKQFGSLVKVSAQAQVGDDFVAHLSFAG